MLATLLSVSFNCSISIRTAGYCLLLLAGLFGSSLAGNPAKTAAPTAVTVSVSSATLCAGASTTLAASGCPTGSSIRWSSAQTTATIVVAPVVTTVYTVNCDVGSTSVVTTTAVVTTPVVTTALVTVGNTTSVVTTTATSTSISVTTALVGSVSSMTAAATVQVNPAIVVVPQIKAVTCAGGEDGDVIITATGGTGQKLYQFNGQPFQPDGVYFALKAGTYPLIVRDSKGCTAQSTIEIKQPPAIVLSLTTVAAKCANGTDGALTALASGGNGDYRYVLNNGAPQQNGLFINLKASTSYTLVVTDSKACSVTQTVPISAPTGFDIKVAVSPTRCVGSADGNIAVTTVGGTGSFQYQIGTGPFQTGSLFTGLPIGTYDITVQDNSGCQTRQSVVVTQPAPLTLSATTRPVNCFGPNSGTIVVASAGGTGAVSYQLTTATTPQTNPAFAGVAVGNYTIVGTDANGCTALTTAMVGQSDPIRVQATPTPATCCVCPTGLVSLTATGGSGTRRQYQVVGQPYQASGQITGLRPNAYRLRVVDEVGCTDSVMVVITDASAISLSPGTVKNIPCAGSPTGEASVQISRGTKPFTFYWQTERGDTLRNRTMMQTGLPEGTYTISVLDSNRCTAPTTTVTIRSLAPVPPKPVVTLSGSTLAVNESVGVQWYVRSGSDPGQPVGNATASTLIPFASGQYYVIVTQNGCSSPASDALNFILTALTEPVAGLSVRVVPNPVIDRLRLEIELVERQAVQVSLFDASGRAVRQYQLPAFVGKKQAEWPLTGLPTGAYLLKAAAGSRQSAVRVLVE